MFIKQTNLIQRGKLVAIIPESFTTVADYIDGGLSENEHHYAVACYWRGVEGGKDITAFGMFSVITMFRGEPHYGLPDGNAYFLENGTKLKYEDFLKLGYVGGEHNPLPGLFDMTHKLGKRAPYDNPHYIARFYPELESFYDADVHRTLHINPEAVPPEVDGWYKWSDKRLAN